MEKIKVSKELARDIEMNEFCICLSLPELCDSHFNELKNIKISADFETEAQVMAYLLGGQKKVYEIEKKPYTVYYGHSVEDFYAVPSDWPSERAGATPIRTCDTKEEAYELTRNLNNQL